MQACPVQLKTEVYPSFAMANLASGVGFAAVAGQRPLGAFGLPALTVGDGAPPALAAPRLLLAPAALCSFYPDITVVNMFLF